MLYQNLLKHAVLATQYFLSEIHNIYIWYVEQSEILMLSNTWQKKYIEHQDEKK